MLKKLQITALTLEGRQAQTEKYIEDVVAEIERQLQDKTLSSMLDSAIMAVKTSKANNRPSESAQYKAIAIKLKELYSLIEKL